MGKGFIKLRVLSHRSNNIRHFLIYEKKDPSQTVDPIA